LGIHNGLTALALAPPEGTKLSEQFSCAGRTFAYAMDTGPLGRDSTLPINVDLKSRREHTNAISAATKTCRRFLTGIIILPLSSDADASSDELLEEHGVKSLLRLMEARMWKGPAGMVVGVGPSTLHQSSIGDRADLKYEMEKSQ
jgi:hypothetical protein